MPAGSTKRARRGPAAAAAATASAVAAAPAEAEASTRRRTRRGAAAGASAATSATKEAAATASIPSEELAEQGSVGDGGGGDGKKKRRRVGGAEEEEAEEAETADAHTAAAAGKGGKGGGSAAAMVVLNARSLRLAVQNLGREGATTLSAAERALLLGLGRELVALGAGEGGQEEEGVVVHGEEKEEWVEVGAGKGGKAAAASSASRPRPPSSAARTTTTAATSSSSGGGKRKGAVLTSITTTPPSSSSSSSSSSSFLPDPVWQHALAFVPPKDLYTVMCASHGFHALTRPYQTAYRHWNLRAAEAQYAPGAYIDQQRHLNAKMRAILLDWILDVHQSLGFRPHTLYRTAYILDQFLIRTENVTREKLQLVGVTAFLVAAKQHEPHPPHPDDCAYWTDHAYSGVEVEQMEARVAKIYLQVLNGPLKPPMASSPAAAASAAASSEPPVAVAPPGTSNLPFPPPTAFDFLSLYLQEAGVGKLASCRAQYYCERTLQEHGMLAFKPSQVAATAVLLTLRAGTPSNSTWPAAMAAYCGYSEDDLRACAIQMCRHTRETVTTLSGRRLDAVKRKYTAGQFLAVSKMEPPSVPEWDPDTTAHAAAAAAADAAALANGNHNHNHNAVANAVAAQPAALANGNGNAAAAGQQPLQQQAAAGAVGAVPPVGGGAAVHVPNGGGVF